MQDFIPWENIEFGNKISGEYKTTCPVCSHTRKPKNRKAKCLSVNMDTGLGYCFNCLRSTFKDTKSITETVEYSLPNQDWKNYTKLSDGLVKWLESRKISQHTAIELGWTMESKYNSRSGKNENMLCFNRFEKDVIVNKKYRTGSSKYFTQDAGGKPIFYNINAAIGQKEVWIVEGQMDVAAFYEVGIKNVMSLPNGAQDNDDVWINSKVYLEGVEKFIIAVDNDEPGKLVCEKIAHRLGKWKCEKVIYKNKDANDDLIEGKDVLLNSIANKERFPVNGTYTANDLSEGLNKLYENGLPETIKPKHRCFKPFNDIFSVMRGHLVTCTGIPSSGKSNFVDWYVLNLVNDYEMKLSLFSPEHHPMELHEAHFIQKVYGKNFFKDYPNTPRVSKKEIQDYNEWANEKIYFTSTENGEFPTWKWYFEKMKEQMFSFGIDIFVIDAFNKLSMNGEGNHLRQIGNVLTKLTMFAQMHNVIIFLVAHPTKMKKDLDTGDYMIPGLYDVSGSSDFRNQTHDGLCVHRFYEDQEAGKEGYTSVYNLKTKMQFQGEINKSGEFEYHLPSGRYYPKGDYPPTHSLIHQEKEVLPVQEPSNDIWDEHKETYLPF